MASVSLVIEESTFPCLNAIPKITWGSFRGEREKMWGSFRGLYSALEKGSEDEENLCENFPVLSNNANAFESRFKSRYVQKILVVRVIWRVLSLLGSR